jgi:hypothetical protein
MKRSDWLIADAAALTAGVLLYMTDRVARQFTDPDEARRYRVRQTLLSVCACTGGALIVRKIGGKAK